MSFFVQIAQWFKNSGLEAAAKQAAVSELTDAANQFHAAIQTHAPDFVQAAEPALTQALTTAIAGAITRK